MRRVDPGRQPEARSNSLQQVEQLLPLGVAQTRAQVPLVCDGHLERLTEEVATGVGEVEGARATILGVEAPFQQAPRLETVDERHHPARRDPETVPDRLL